jgi:menaquinone-specific isochorismate synthase
MFKNWRLRQQCYSWKHYISGQVNARRGTSGTLFQSESFDHLVRDGDHFEKFRRYIAKNPQQAGLSPGSYQLVGCGPVTP